MAPDGEPVQDVEQKRIDKAWKKRPFARTFDLISNAYGWTDGQILDLTLERMHQIRDVIWERQEEDHRADLRTREVELQTLATHMAMNAGNKHGVAAAERIRLVPEDVDPKTGQPVKEVVPIPYAAAKRWFGG